jgi:hypothetical protein
MVKAATEVAAAPNRADLASTLMTYSFDLERWNDPDAAVSIEDGTHIGAALYETGQFAAARPWFERAVAEADQGDVHGRVDHASLKSIRQALANCLREIGRTD